MVGLKFMNLIYLTNKITMYHIDDKIILTGVFVEFDKINRSNGRIYPRELYDEEFRKYKIKLKKEERIKKLQKINKLNE